MSIEIIDDFTSHLDDNLSKCEALFKDTKTALNEMRALKKKSLKLIKLASKVKRRRNEDGKEPSGFTSPIEISDELADFLAVERGISMPRAKVTKAIFEYVKEHGLKNCNDGRIFDLSDTSNVYAQTLKRLLNVTDEDKVGYFTLQKHLKHHFKSNSQSISQQTQTVEEEEEEDNNNNEDENEETKDDTMLTPASTESTQPPVNNKKKPQLKRKNAETSS
jgi:chromatin remodeling complex protein RSC6